MTFSVNSASVAPIVYGTKKIEALPAKQSATAAQNLASAPSEGFWDYFTEGLAGLLLSPLSCNRTPMDWLQPKGTTANSPKDAGAPDPIPNSTATSVSTDNSVKDASPAGGPDALIPLDSAPSVDQIVFGAPDAQADLAGPDSVATPDLLPDLVPADKCHPADGILTNIFNDKLLAAIRHSLGKGATDEITTDDVLNTTRLDIPAYAGVTRLEGIECFENLVMLEASFNNLSDFSPLAGMKNLIQLDFNVCNISDSELSSLPFLPSLRYLWLVENQITGLSPLAKYPTLYLLGVNYNNIADLSPIASLPNLAEIYAVSLPLSDLSPLKSLANATYLDFRNDPISDISPLLENPNVGKNTEIHLEGNTTIPPGQITALINKGANVFWP
jgi:Leucine-rich repeat (LRR) protein